MVTVRSRPTDRLPGSLTGRRPPLDATYVDYYHFCAERCVHITPIERRILEGVARGQGNIQIGQELNISHHTVFNHVHTLRDKLSCHDRISLALKAVACGLLENPHEREAKKKGT